MSFTGFQALTPAYIDDTLQILPANGNVTPALASTVQLNLPKNSTLIGKCFLEVTLSAGTTLLATTAVPAGVAFNPDLPYVAENSGGAENFPAAEYNKSVGDLLLDSNTMIYGNTNLQNLKGVINVCWCQCLKSRERHRGVFPIERTRELGSFSSQNGLSRVV